MDNNDYVNLNEATKAPIKYSLNEDKLDRLLGIHEKNGYIIISACREDWSDDKAENKTINKQKTKQLCSDIHKAGYTFCPVYGGSMEEIDGKKVSVPGEASMIVYNSNREGKAGDISKLFALGKHLTKKYNQYSFYYKENGKNPAWIDRNGKTIQKFGNLKIARVAKEATEKYFTDFNNPKKIDAGKIKRFSAMEEEIYFNPPSSSFGEKRVRETSGEMILEEKVFNY